jgi:tape measure domain-containing protein
MAQYDINFSTNASQIAKELGTVQSELAKVVRVLKPGKFSIKLDLNTADFTRAINSSFKELDQVISEIEKKLRQAKIGSPEFRLAAEQSGQLRGESQRGQMMARAIGSREAAKAFDVGSLARYERVLEGLRTQASLIAPNTQEWVNFQKSIGEITLELKQADKAAESIQLTQQLGALAPGSLSRLETQLTILKNRAREIKPNTDEWKRLNKEIQNVETSIQKVTKKPMTMGQRAGAAGGAFLYGGGLGGGAGSALGGIAGGLAGGVPGAFTGAAVGQFADNIGMLASKMAEQAAAVRRLQSGLAGASTSLQDYGLANQEVERISNRLLIPIDEVTRKFTQLKASTIALGIDTKTTGEIFEGTAAAVLQSGGSMDDVSGAMRAVVQVFSKGKLTAEELRGQLAERLPGAVVEFARVSGKSLQQIDKEFEAGEATLDDFVKFLKSKKNDTSDYVDEMATSSEFAGARMSKAFEKLRINIGNALQPTGAVIQDFATNSIRFLDALIRKAIESKLIQPGPEFLASEALAGRQGGVAGLEERLLQQSELEGKLRKTADSMGLGFIIDFSKPLQNAAKEAKNLEEALVTIRKLEKLTKEREKQAEDETKKAEKDQTAASYLDAVENREESLANARKQYEENIASIRQNAIKQAENLERKYQDGRVQAERDLARIRREIEGEQSTAGFVRRNILSLSTGESSSLIEAEQAAAEIVRNYTEEKITAEEASQDKQIQLVREVEDFKKINAEAISQANVRYAKSIGEIQARYAKTVAKLIEEGSGNGAKKLAAAGKVIAAMIAKASAQQAFTAAAGTPIIPRGQGTYDIAGETYTEAEVSEIVAAQRMKADPVQKAIGGALEAYVAADKEAVAGAKDLGVKLGLTAEAQMPSIPSVSTADIDARVEASAATLSRQQSQVGGAGQELNVVKAVTSLLSLSEQQTKEAQRLGEELDRQTQTTLEQVQLMNQGMGPASAKRLMEAEELFDVQRALLNSMEKGAMAEAQKAPSAEARKTIETEIKKIFVEQFEAIKENEKAYGNLLASAQNARGLFKQAELIEEIRVLRMASDEARRIYELMEEGYSSESAQQIFDLEKIKKNIEDTRALIDGFVSQTSSDYKGFLKAVISGEDAADALKQFQEGLKDRVLTIFLDFAMAPVEKFLKESLEGLFLPKAPKELKPEEEKAKTGIEGNTVATNANTTAINNLTTAFQGAGATGGGGGGVFDAANVFGGGGNLTSGIFDTIAQQMGGATESFDSFSSHMSQFVDSSIASSESLGTWTNEGLKNLSSEATTASGKWQESLGKAVGAIGIAAGSIMGIAAGISQIKEGGTANVLGGIGSIMTSIGGGIMGFMSLGKAANGAVWKGGFQAFANGGTVTGPTLGLIGEGKYNEAIVPLPDGRSIPVQFNQQSSLREAMAGSGNNTPAPSVLSMTFESTNINGVEYVSRDQLEQAMAQTRRQASRDGAQRGMTMTLDKLQQSPSTRSRIGMR